MSDKKNPKDHGIEHYQHLDLDTDVSEQLKDVYSNWADSYDDDNDHKLKTVSQPNTVAMLMRHCTSKELQIFDVGCGTGIVGQHLSVNGFSNFDGTDPSQEMMQHAKSRGYTNLLKLIPGEPLPARDNAYDASLCVGVFTHAHLGPEGFPELIRVTKPDGIICFTVNEGVWESGGFETAIKQYADAGEWQVLEKTKQDYMVNEGVEAWYVAVKKTANNNI